MDKRGGGTALRDMLREPEDKSRLPIVDLVTDEKAKYIPEKLDMMRLVNATAEYNTTMVNTVKAKMQSRKLLMPKIVSTHPDPKMERIYLDLLALRSQFGKVKSRSVGGGWRKFYVPERKSTDESLERGYKDLFSSTLYAMEALLSYCGIEGKIRQKKDYSKIPLPHFVQPGPIRR
jgi:hypothetical protein